jgi:hypothetical protein
MRYELERQDNSVTGIMENSSNGMDTVSNNRNKYYIVIGYFNSIVRYSKVILVVFL